MGYIKVREVPALSPQELQALPRSSPEDIWPRLLFDGCWYVTANAFASASGNSTAKRRRIQDSAAGPRGSINISICARLTRSKCQRMACPGAASLAPRLGIRSTHRRTSSIAAGCRLNLVRVKRECNLFDSTSWRDLPAPLNIGPGLRTIRRPLGGAGCACSRFRASCYMRPQHRRRPSTSTRNASGSCQSQDRSQTSTKGTHDGVSCFSFRQVVMELISRAASHCFPYM